MDSYNCTHPFRLCFLELCFFGLLLVLEALFLRANIKVDLEDYPGAIKDYTLVLHQKPSLERILHYRANTYLLDKRYEAAIDDYSSVLKEDSSNADANYKRGNAKAAIKNTMIDPTEIECG